MPRIPRPWFRTSKNAWYATLNGRKVSLRVFGKEKKADALIAWHRLMAEGLKPKAEPKPATVKAIIDGFLADAESRVSPECLRNYRKHLLPFVKKHGSRPADGLTVADAEAYTRQPGWSASYRNGVLGSLVSAFRWAERTGILTTNPLRQPTRVEQ